jgi:hypothetical protein
MIDQIRIIPHSPEGIPDAGTFESRLAGREALPFCDDLPVRRAITQRLSRQVALEQAGELARKTAHLDSKSGQPIVVELCNG